MRQKFVPGREPATQVVKNIRRATRRHFSAEDKIRIVLEGLRGEDSIAELCRREGIVQNLCPSSKFLRQRAGQIKGGSGSSG
jgi:transposase